MRIRARPVAVLAYAKRKSRFGGDRGVVGSEIRMGRSRTVIVGVMPEGFAFPRDHELWLPLHVAAVAAREGPPVEVFGRLGENTTRRLRAKQHRILRRTHICARACTDLPRRAGPALRQNLC